MLHSYRDLAACVLAVSLGGCSSPGAMGATSGSSPATTPAVTATEGAPAAGSAGRAAPSGVAGLSGAEASSAGHAAMAGTQAAGAPAGAPPSAGNAGVSGPQPNAGASQPEAGAAAEPTPPPRACAAMVAAAKDFIGSLDSAELNSAALQPFESHHNFAYEPQVADRPGVSLAMLSEAQQTKALALLRTGLSDAGFEKAETVRALENLRLATGFQINMRDPTYYWLAIFGEPSETGEWGWQWEGHHLALHYTLRACAIADTPTFMGAWPAEVASMMTGGPPVGTRNLAQEEDLGRVLAKSLDADPAKRMQAFMSGAYRQMLPEGPDRAEPMMPAGLAGSAMSASEREQLRQIVSAYASVMPPELGEARLKRIEDHGGFEAVSFVWTGELEPKQRHFYRIQGPSFFIEYRNDDGDHIHSAWRDFDGDFGDDLP